mmetsp:Transcript_94550/g.282345  ORF Transcript_94550/g.282345 Transcript_94550/m.282345 type:complete len:263 (+) Transcript_94550:477-1265(+)
MDRAVARRGCERGAQGSLRALGGGCRGSSSLPAEVLPRHPTASSEGGASAEGQHSKSATGGEGQGIHTRPRGTHKGAGRGGRAGARRAHQGRRGTLRAGGLSRRGHPSREDAQRRGEVSGGAEDGAVVDGRGRGAEVPGGGHGVSQEGGCAVPAGDPHQRQRGYPGVRCGSLGESLPREPWEPGDRGKGGSHQAPRGGALRSDQRSTGGGLRHLEPHRRERGDQRHGRQKRRHTQAHRTAEEHVRHRAGECGRCPHARDDVQ